ncbi:DMT family transporter [Seohaeicola saemankumensis]|uniref:DMT family transporter n=1 Tax=Seohaeicola saemankumensis TaxID=481181 RepID=A0ABW3TEB0_9RHOB
MSDVRSPALPYLNDRIVLGVVLMLGFCLTAPLIDVASKLAAQTIPVGQVTTARFIVQGLLMLPLCLMLGHGLRLPPGVLTRLVLRALFLILSTYFFVAAVKVMPIADALVIVFVEPFILLLLGKYLFGEEVGPRRLWASVVGFAGALLVIQPSLAAFGLVALFPLGTALFFAFYMLVTRSLSRQMHPVPMQFHTSTVAAAICLPVMLLGTGITIPTISPVWPQGVEWTWLAGVGAASALAHLMISYALRYAPSATVAPLHYLEILSAVVFGWLFFSDLPNALTFAGMAVITASGLYIFHRERVLEREARTGS